MAESSITKKAMANSLKNLMQTKSFQKISINDICSGCNMNRKSFYYHFQDKYDLLNWIFDTEFREFILQNEDLETWDLLRDLCYYLYENRKFYRKALAVEGQNSFSSYLHSLVFNRISDALKAMSTENDELTLDKIQLQFITDGIMCALTRWLVSPDNMTADEFIDKLRSMVTRLMKAIYKKYAE